MYISIYTRELLNLSWYITIQLVYILILVFDIEVKQKKLFTIYAVKGKYWNIYKKNIAWQYLRREFAVGAVAVISHNIWKSKLYINTEGQLFWYLNTFERYVSRHILTFDIVTILKRCYRYIEELLSFVLKIVVSGADCGF